MMTDTGSFQYNGVNSKTFKIASDLLKKDIKQSDIYNKIYNENNISKLKLLGKALSNLNIIKESKTTYMYLKRDNLAGSNYEKGDTEGIVKTIFNKETGELIGAHLIGSDVTELINSLSVAKSLETTEVELMKTVFAHPTLSETLHESVLSAFDRAIHI